jgi:hypothetical protein
VKFKRQELIDPILAIKILNSEMANHSGVVMACSKFKLNHTLNTLDRKLSAYVGRLKRYYNDKRRFVPRDEKIYDYTLIEPIPELKTNNQNSI